MLTPHNFDKNRPLTTEELLALPPAVSSFLSLLESWDTFVLYSVRGRSEIILDFDDSETLCSYSLTFLRDHSFRSLEVSTSLSEDVTSYGDLDIAKSILLSRKRSSDNEI